MLAVTGSKPEKWFYVQSMNNGLEHWLRARTVGLCTTYNRLLEFRVVRSTRSVVWTPARMVEDQDRTLMRSADHLEKHPEYADPVYYLTYQAKYLFRNHALRHLRVEQFNRYCYVCGDEGKNAATLEEIDQEEYGFRIANRDHRNYDAFMEGVPPGTLFRSAFAGAPNCRRRHDARLGVSRLPQLECAGGEREAFYEQRLWVGLPFHCETKPEVRMLDDDKQATVWRLKWRKPAAEDLNGLVLEDEALELTNRPKLNDISYELMCKHFERKFADAELDLLCPCCAESIADSPCGQCKLAIGFHMCTNPRSSRRGFLQWRQGSLHNGKLDAQRVIWNLHRRQLPEHVLEDKIKLYLGEGLLDEGQAEEMLKNILAERGKTPIENFMGEGGEEEAGAGAVPSGPRKLTMAQMEALLAKRIELMQAGGKDCKDSDQYRVFKFIIEVLQSGKKLRLMVQASAGTGKSPCLSVKVGFASVARLATCGGVDARLPAHNGFLVVSNAEDEDARCSSYKLAC